MQDSQNNLSKKLNNDLIKQAKQMLSDCHDYDKMFRGLLKQHWKDAKIVGELNDAILQNKELMESLRDEIKTRTS